MFKIVNLIYRKVTNNRNLSAERVVFEGMLPYFDRAYYSNQDPELVSYEGDLLEHYLKEGWKRGLDPSSQFSTRGYLSAYPDVEVGGINPLFHFIKYGHSEERECITVTMVQDRFNKRAINTTSVEITNKLSLEDYERLALEKKFNSEYYLNQIKDEGLEGLDPLEHYLIHGSARGLDPCIEFSSNYYILHNPDVVAAGIFPFLHFCLSGESENRMSRHPLGTRANILENLNAPDEQRRAWLRRDKIEIGDSEILDTILREVTSRSKGLVLAFSNDNYKEHTGGIQLCVEIEEQEFINKKKAYLQLSPAQALPTLAVGTDPMRFIITLVLNGNMIGHFSADILIEKLSALPKHTVQDIIIHSLMGFDLETLSLIFMTIPNVGKYFWIHDYFSICPGYNLLRNSLTYCGAPSKDSMECGICIYGEERRIMSDKIKTFFSDQRFNIIAPSKSAAELWQLHSGLVYSSLKVHNHCTLSPRVSVISSGNDLSIDNFKKEPVRIAFMGYPVAPKGWFIFEELVHKWRDDPRYEFHHFGARESTLLDIKFHKIRVDAHDKNGMIASLQDFCIDFVLIISIWPETFCITAHEAIAAGADIITFKDSGNVPVLVSASEKGIVIEDVEELNQLFIKDALTARAIEMRKNGRLLYDMQWSSMTVDCVKNKSKNKSKKFRKSFSKSN